MESIVSDIESLMVDGEYEMALMQTVFIEWNGSDEESTKYWEMRKESLIKK